MYKPFFIKTSLIFFILLASCAPVNNITKDKNNKTDKTNIVASTEILHESNTKQETVKLEEKNLEELIKRVDNSVKKLSNYDYELIFINDDSDDDSEKLLLNLLVMIKQFKMQ